jgi:hypothetical protein
MNDFPAAVPLTQPAVVKAAEKRKPAKKKARGK